MRHQWHQWWWSIRWWLSRGEEDMKRQLGVMDHCLTCLGASPHLLLLPIFSIRISYFTSCLISFLRSASPPHICMFLRLSEPSPGARVVLRKLMHLPFFSYFPLSNHQFDHQPVFLRKKMLRWWDCEMLRCWDCEMLRRWDCESWSNDSVGSGVVTLSVELDQLVLLFFLYCIVVLPHLSSRWLHLTSFYIQYSNRNFIVPPWIVSLYLC